MGWSGFQEAGLACEEVFDQARVCLCESALAQEVEQSIHNGGLERMVGEWLVRVYAEDNIALLGTERFRVHEIYFKPVVK